MADAKIYLGLVPAFLGRRLQTSDVESVHLNACTWLTEEAQLILPCSPNAYHQKVQMIFNRLSVSNSQVFRSVHDPLIRIKQAPTIWGSVSLYKLILLCMWVGTSSPIGCGMESIQHTFQWFILQ